MLREPVMTVTIMAVVRDDHDDASDKISWVTMLNMTMITIVHNADDCRR